jgi:branched-chain amino acid transport system ATP-binding protein/branched-chain amino acid transport system permease protein
MPLPASDATLTVSNVSKTFGGLTAVSAASLAVAPGTVHGLIGPNGAGKSTLIGIISGFVRPFAGDVRFAGRSVGALAPAEIARLGLARTFQQATPIAGLTALENVMVGMHVHYRATVGAVLLRLPAMRREARAHEAAARRVLDEFELAADADADAAGLPFGKLRFLELARAIVMRPRVLLLDEPAAGLNAAETLRLEEIIRAQAALGAGILLVDHDVPFVFRLSNEVTVMNFGSVIASGRPDDVYRDSAVREAYLGPAQDNPVQDNPVQDNPVYDDPAHDREPAP